MWIADSWIQIEQFRLLVMYTAWLIDQSSTAAVRQYVAATKVLAADILTDISIKTTHIHGALGVSNAMSLGGGGGAWVWSTARPRCTSSRSPSRC